MADEDQKGIEDKEYSTSASEFLGSTYINTQNINDIGLIGIREISEVEPRNVSKEGYPPEMKLTVGFKGFKGYILTLNQTNGKVLMSKYGDDYKQWIGKKVEIYTEKVKYKGKDVDGIKLRIPEV